MKPTSTTTLSTSAAATSLPFLEHVETAFAAKQATMKGDIYDRDGLVGLEADRR